MTTGPSAPCDAVNERIVGRLRCPSCTADVEVSGDTLRCVSCGTDYSESDGIFQFARFGTAETWGQDEEEESSQKYQTQYDGEGRADAYNAKYRQKFFKRRSTQREFHIIDRLLSSQGRSEVLLDLPCGGGRLSHRMTPHTDLLIEADASIGQVRHAKTDVITPTPRWFMTASAFHIPLKDQSVDGVVCPRLCHHLPSTEERERLVRELLRVARRFVIMTYFDYDTLKNRIRRYRTRKKRKRPKKTMPRAQVAALAKECGAELVAAPHLSIIGSGHRYALMTRRRD